MQSSFSPATRAWFGERFAGATDVQLRGWDAIARGEHALLIAPTGSGKTLAAFLWAIDRLSVARTTPAPAMRVLYVSPLKALVYDIERNLRVPLAGIARERGAPRRVAASAARRRAHAATRRQRERRAQARATRPRSS